MMYGQAWRSRRTFLLLLGLTLLLPLAACSGEGDTSTRPADAAGADDPLNLRAVCPDPIVIQTGWLPGADEGQLYALLGPSPEIDTQRKRVTAPLVTQGKDTGVKVEIRAGGPAIGFEQTSAQMYLDTSITLGMPTLDEQIQLSATQPMLGVMAPVEIDPQIILWDPGKHPEFNAIKDIGQTNTPVVYFEGDTYMEYLVGSGFLQRGQVDGSFDGSPSRFVASEGEIAQSGYATNHPYMFENEVKEWGKQIKYQLVYETGYPNYGNLLSIRPNDKDELAPCLRKLIPIMQQAEVDFYAKPEATIDLVVKLSEAYQSEEVLSKGNVTFAVQQMKQLNLVGNGDDGTLGNFDEARVQRMIDIVRPIFATQNKQIKAGLKPSDLFTNEFIESKIGLSP